MIWYEVFVTSILIKDTDGLELASAVNDPGIIIVSLPTNLVC